MDHTANTTSFQLDEDLGTSIRLAAHVASTLVLAGKRQFDRFCVSNPGDAPPRIVSLENLVHDSLEAQATWRFDPAQGQITLLRAAAGYTPPGASLPGQIGQTGEKSLPAALAAFAALPTPGENARVALLIDAGLLFHNPGSPVDEEDVTHLRALERHARTAPRSHQLLLRVPQTSAIPAALLGEPKLRTVPIPATTRDVRYAYARLRSEDLARQCQASTDAVARVVATMTEDLNLDIIEKLIHACVRHGITSLVEIEDLARAIRLGATKSPWVGQEIRETVRQAQTTLGRRVKGQPQAVNAVIKGLKKACTGLAGGHGPRAVLFFSGPTGTGKTELAKAIAEMVYGAEDAILRFDCAEFRQDHAVARLLGAPPGYVGYEAGSELIEAVRAKPYRVILFDEIEKAHPRFFDVFLSILQDGRLTDGSGQTADFSQSVLLFTSNLGMYEEQTDARGHVSRVPRFNYDTSYEEIQKSVREAIRDFFINQLGRPEILGRLGGHESVTVFDFLRDLEGVAAKFIHNLRDRCQRVYGMDLEVAPALQAAMVENVRSKPEAMLLGGRGLAATMDRMLEEPLNDYLFDTHPCPKRLRVGWQDGQTHFEVLD